MIEKGATISSCRRYRYRLWREWNCRKPYLCWIMLNPSKADAQFDDPTIRRCMSFSARWGYGGMHVINLFALRATDPREIFSAEDPIGPENDKTILSYARWPIVAGWGRHGNYRDRDKAVLEILRQAEIKHLGLTKCGHPRHPFYVAGHFLPLFMNIMAIKERM